MATGGGPKEASLGEVSEEGEEPILFQELPTPAPTQKEDRGRSPAQEEEESLDVFKSWLQNSKGKRDTLAVLPVPKKLVTKLEGGPERGSQEKCQKFTPAIEREMRVKDREWDDDSWGGRVTAAVKEDENHENPKKRLNFSETEESEEYEAFYRRGQRERREEEEQGCRMCLHSQSKGGKVHWDTESKGPGQYPIMATSGGDRRYKPFNVRDVTGLVQMLPPITEGGAA